MIVVAGEALIDRIVRADGSAKELPGGGPFNTARTIARLGVPVGFLGRLSTDRRGTILRRSLAADGVDLSFAAATTTPTTLAIADIGTDGTARYQFQTAGTSASSLDVESIRAAFEIPPAALHVGTLGLVLEPIATTLAGSVACTGAGTLVMVDPNCRPQAIPDRAAYLARLGEVLGRADVVKASVDDLGYLWPDSSVADCAGRLLEGGSRVVLVTDGPGPVSCHTPTFAFEVAVPSVVPIDTVGAGDAFGGAFLARWIERGLGSDQLADETALREAIGLAVEVAGWTCLRAGADPPRRHEVAWPAT